MIDTSVSLIAMPAVAVKMPKAFPGIRKEALRDTAHTQAWWQEHIRAMDSRDLEATKRALDDARKKQIEMTKVQARAVFVGVQSIYDQLLALMGIFDILGTDQSDGTSVTSFMEKAGGKRPGCWSHGRPRFVNGFTGKSRSERAA